MGRHKRQAPTTCEVCGNTKMVPVSTARVQRYCSRACYYKGRRKSALEFTCQQCGKVSPLNVERKQPQMFCSVKCRTDSQRKGGYVSQQGYRVISVDAKPVLEHRHVMEKILGRPLLPSESVHHRNGDRLDNDPANLELWVKVQLAGQRVTDLVAYIVAYHRPAVLEALAHVSTPHSGTTAASGACEVIAG